MVSDLSNLSKVKEEFFKKCGGKGIMKKKVKMRLDRLDTPDKTTLLF